MVCLAHKITDRSVSGLRRFFRRHACDYTRFNYLGEWHSHPLFYPIPSATDHASMRALVTDPAMGANFLVLMIVKLDGRGALTGTVQTYLPDGTACEGELHLEADDAQDPS